MYQNRDDYKIAILETRNLRLYKIMNYGIRTDLKYILEDLENNCKNNRTYLLFGKQIAVVDNKTFNLIMRKQYENYIMKLISYGNNRHLIGI